MTIQDLIEQLQKFDPKLPVIVKEGKYGFVKAHWVKPGEFFEEGDWQPEDGECYTCKSVLIS
jgi:hypothetical protein